MREIYSIYDAKAHLSKILKKVKAGQEVLISERGTPIVKLVPLPKEQSLRQRIAYLKSIGVILPRKNKKLPKFPKSLKRPGALRRFLKERE